METWFYKIEHKPIQAGFLQVTAALWRLDSSLQCNAEWIKVEAPTEDEFISLVSPK